MLINRRKFLRDSASMVTAALTIPLRTNASLLPCTPAPEFPVPLTEGTWRSAALPIGKHDYHVWLNVDRSLPLEKLDCDLGPSTLHGKCTGMPLLDVDWKIWNGAVEVKSYKANPIQAAGWAADTTSVFLGDFEGIRNGKFVFEWIVRRTLAVSRICTPEYSSLRIPAIGVGFSDLKQKGRSF